MTHSLFTLYSSSFSTAARYDGCKPPTFGSNPHINSIIRTRERANPVTPNMLENILQLNSSEEIMDASTRSSGRERKKSFFTWHLTKNKASKAYHSSESSKSRTSKSTHSDRNRFKQTIDPRMDKRSIESAYSVRTPFVGKSQNKRERLTKLTSQPKLDGGTQDEIPSLFLQEASHLISLLSAVAFTTLRHDLHSAPSPLQEYTPGAPWPPVDVSLFYQI
jgi:hypothetical protein